ncbi:MAG: glycosyltransferase family 4 protein [Saprospiraceae bacterium]
MRVLFYNDYFHPLGGAETYLYATASALKARGVDVLTVAFDRSTSLRGCHWLSSFWTNRFRHSRPITALTRAIETFQPDIIHVNKNYLYTRSINAVLAKAGIPLVQTIHDYYALSDHWNLKFKLRQWLFGSSIRPANYIIPSRCLFSRIKTSQPGRFTYIPHFVDSDLWYYKCPDPTINNRLLFVGRLERSKGIFTFLEAMRMLKQQVPQLTLTCIGDGMHKEALLRLIGQYELQHCILLTGHQCWQAVRQYFHNSTILIYPSLKPELFGLAGIEGQSCGIPVIASDVGGVNEWCKHNQTGILVPPDNLEVLVSEIMRLLRNPELRMELSQRARQAVRLHFNEKNAIDQLLTLYTSLL